MNPAGSKWRRSLAMTFALSAAPLAAWANCADTYFELKDVRALEAKAFAKLKAGREQAYFDRFEGDSIFMTEAFDGLDAKHKEALVTPLPRAFSTEMPEPAFEQMRSGSAVASPILVRDHTGRKLYTETPCFGDFLTLTEHQRYLAMFSFGESNERAFRKQTHALPAAIRLQDVKKRFHGIMSWKPAYFINWAPEGGFFEINLEKRAELAKLDAFWPVAPKGYRYDVLLNDGSRIAQKTL